MSKFYSKVFIYNSRHELVFVAFAYSASQIEFWKADSHWVNNEFCYGYSVEQ